MTAPLYRDPVFDGATDPVVVWHAERRQWWMFYTARRATAPGPGVAWVHGSDIGVAVSDDGGRSWLYRGTAQGLDVEWGRNTFWAPEVVRAEGRYHMFVSYIRGVPDQWAGHGRQILHYTSQDLIGWQHHGPVALGSARVIDAALHPLPGGGYRMWFKDEEHGSHTYCADSPDLEAWGPARPALTGFEHEGPNVFRLGGRYWLIVDDWHGLRTYCSADLETWEPNGRILGEPDRRADDQDVGRHADAVVCGGTGYLFYFTHPGLSAAGGDGSYASRRSSIQVAQLGVYGGTLRCDRDAPFEPELRPDA